MYMSSGRGVGDGAQHPSYRVAYHELLCMSDKCCAISATCVIAAVRSRVTGQSMPCILEGQREVQSLSAPIGFSRKVAHSQHDVLWSRSEWNH